MEPWPGYCRPIHKLFIPKVSKPPNNEQNNKYGGYAHCIRHISPSNSSLLGSNL